MNRVGDHPAPELVHPVLERSPHLRGVGAGALGHGQSDDGLGRRAALRIEGVILDLRRSVRDRRHAADLDQAAVAHVEHDVPHVLGRTQEGPRLDVNHAIPGGEVSGIDLNVGHADPIDHGRRIEAIGRQPGRVQLDPDLAGLAPGDGHVSDVRHRLQTGTELLGQRA